jgi:phage protein D
MGLTMSGSTLAEWRTEIIAVVSAVAGALFGHLRYKRQASKTRLSEAEDSAGVYHVQSLRADRESMQTKADAYLDLLQTTRHELAEAKARGRARDVQLRAIQAHVLLVTRLVSEGRPELAQELNTSAFMALFHDSGSKPEP